MPLLPCNRQRSEALGPPTPQSAGRGKLASLPIHPCSSHPPITLHSIPASQLEAVWPPSLTSLIYWVAQIDPLEKAVI